MKTVSLLILALALSGCGTLIPKRVELFQDKVAKYPIVNAAEKEIQRQTASRAAEKAEETFRAALTTCASETVTKPALDTVKLTDAVSTSLGPPLNPASVKTSSEELSTQLNTAVAKLNRRIDSFREDNDKNAGKKIEDTGLFKIPYFVWLGGFLLLAFVGFLVLSVLWTFLKMYGVSNPAVGLGLNAVSLGGKVTAGALSQVLKGGQKFKDRMAEQFPEIKDKIIAAFHAAHKEEQSPEVQQAVAKLTEK